MSKQTQSVHNEQWEETDHSVGVVIVPRFATHTICTHMQTRP
jgi:hypothetical protein